MMAYTGRLFQASGKSNIGGLLVEVYEKVGIPVIAVCERTQKGYHGLCHIYKTLRS